MPDIPEATLDPYLGYNFSYLPESPTTTTRAHHPDSPSSLQSSEACPCFKNEQRESAASAAGTLQHTATETRDLSILGGNEAMEAAVSKAIAYEDAILNKLKLARIDYRILREEKLTVGDDDVTSGFPDTVIIAGTHAIILDWKFGQVPVTETKDNLQGISYWLGLLHREPKVVTCEVHFVAPYQGWSEDAQRIKYTHTFHKDDAAKNELRVRVVIAKKHEAYAKVEQGDWSLAKPKADLCIWCERKGVCPKVGQLVVQTNEKYHDLVVPDVVKEWKIITVDQVANAYKFANQMGPIIEAIKKRCVEVAVQDDLLPPNYKIVKSQHRKIKSVGGFLRVALETGLTPEEATELLSVSFKPFEDWIKLHAPKGKGAARLREFNATLEENGVVEPGTPFYFLREVKTPADQVAIDV